MDMVGVYDANTRTGKSVRLSQHSVPQNGDWTIFNFGTGYALSTRKVYKTISATTAYGSLFFCSYRFDAPDIYDSILYADVNPVTGNGLWLGHYREINDVTTVICYLSSTTSMSNVGMYVQETVIGKLKQHSVSQTNGQFKYVKDNNIGYICYSNISDILFITIVNCYVKSGYTTLCTLPQGCRPTEQIVFAISDNVAANYSYQRYCIIKLKI